MAMFILLKLTCTSKNEKCHGTGCVYSSQDYPWKSGLEITALEYMLKF